MVARLAGTGMQAAQRHVRRGGNSLITTARLAPVTLLLAAALAAPALAQGGPKPAPTRVPTQAPVLRMSQSPDPTFDEGTIQRMAAAMLSYTVLEVQGGWPMLPPSSSKLAPGSTGPDVVALRHRLSITDDLPADQANGEVYDDALAAGVRRFQARHGLTETGSIGPKTLSALNVPVGKRLRPAWRFARPSRRHGFHFRPALRGGESSRRIRRGRRWRQGRAPLRRGGGQAGPSLADADDICHGGQSQPDLDGAAVDHEEATAFRLGQKSNSHRMKLRRLLPAAAAGKHTESGWDSGARVLARVVALRRRRGRARPSRLRRTWRWLRSTG